MIKDKLDNRIHFLRSTFTILVLCIGMSSNGYGSSNSFAVCPCIDVYASVPGNCPSTEPLGMAIYQTGPGIAYNVDRSISLFIRDQNGELEYTAQQGTTTLSSPPTWKNIHGYVNSDPVVVFSKGGALDVFYIGLDETIWHIKQQSGTTWGTPASIGGNAGGQVTAAASPASSAVQLFYKGDDQSLMTIIGNGGAWGKPVAILPAGSVTSNIASIDVGSGRYLFYRGTDGSLKSIALSLGSTTASAPMTLTKPWAVTSNIAPALDANGAIIAFYRGPDNALWDVPLINGSHPVSLGGRASSDLAVTTLPGKQIRVYYRSTDGGVYYVQQSQISASGWSKHMHLLGLSASAKNSSSSPLLSQTLFSNPVVGVNPDGRQEIFYVGNGGIVWQMTETTTSSPAQPYPSWSYPTALQESICLAPRGNSIIAETHAGSRPIASYTVLDAATVSDIINQAPYFDTCTETTAGPMIGFNHVLPTCDNAPAISRAMGIALLIDDIQVAIDTIKTSTAGSVTQVQFDVLIKAQLKKMGIL